MIEATFTYKEPMNTFELAAEVERSSEFRKLDGSKEAIGTLLDSGSCSGLNWSLSWKIPLPKRTRMALLKELLGQNGETPSGRANVLGNTGSKTPKPARPAS